MRTPWPGGMVLCVAGTLLASGCATFGEPFTPTDTAVGPARAGPVAVVVGDPGPSAETLAAAVAARLRRDGVTVVPAKAVDRARRAFADELPVATRGRYMHKRYHPEVANLPLGAQLLRAMKAPAVLVVWGPGLKDIGAGDTIETLVGQLYGRGPGGPRLLGYTLYYLVLGTDWSDAAIDQETRGAGDRIARAVEARLGGR